MSDIGSKPEFITAVDGPFLSFTREIESMLQEVTSSFKDAHNQLEKKKQVVVGDRRQLEEERNEWEKLKQKLNMSNIKDPIKLNVGGTIFYTSVGTLTSLSAKESYFHALFSGRWQINILKDGSIFIDRDPTFFRHILNYMRGEIFTQKVLSDSERNGLVQEATFYCLYGMLASLLPFAPGPNYKLNNLGNQAKCLSNSWNCTVVGPQIKPDSTPTISLIKTADANIMVGLATKNINQHNHYNFNDDGCGWYFNCERHCLEAWTRNVKRQRYHNLEGRMMTGTIGVRLGGNHEISFIINGIDHGRAYKVSPDTDYYLVVLLGHAGDIVELSWK